LCVGPRDAVLFFRVFPLFSVHNGLQLACSLTHMSESHLFFPFVRSLCIQSSARFDSFLHSNFGGHLYGDFSARTFAASVALILNQISKIAISDNLIYCSAGRDNRHQPRLCALSV
jgi:hypothetical protein